MMKILGTYPADGAERWFRGQVFEFSVNDLGVLFRFCSDALCAE